MTWVLSKLSEFSFMYANVMHTAINYHSGLNVSYENKLNH
jgi:hypothetical protein